MLLATLALCTIFLPSGSGTDVEVQGQCKIEVAETTEQEVEMAYKQVTTPNTTVQDGIGWCLRHTQSVFASPVNFPSARKAWDGQQGRHTDIPPLGISVPIFFDHYGTYGSPAFWDNWGHVATRLADGRVLTSPMYSSYGSEIYPDIPSMMNALGGGAKYLGWSEYMNGKQIVKKVSNPAPNPQPAPPAEEEDEDVRPICIAKTTKGNTVEVTIFSFDTGEEHSFISSRNEKGHAYNTNVALTYGCAPGVPISYITESHYNRIKADNRATRERLAKK